MKESGFKDLETEPPHPTSVTNVLMEGWSEHPINTLKRVGSLPRRVVTAVKGGPTSH